MRKTVDLVPCNRAPKPFKFHLAGLIGSLLLCVLTLVSMLAPERAVASDVEPYSVATFAFSDQRLSLELIVPAQALPEGGAVEAWYAAEAPLLLVDPRGLLLPKLLEADLGAAPGAGLSRQWRLRLELDNLGPRETLQFQWFDGAGRLLMQPAASGTEGRAVLMSAGTRSARIAFDGKEILSPAVALLAYVPRGFGLLIGQGAQYVLFLLALCLLSARQYPQFVQVALYAGASTVTLWGGALLAPALPVWLTGLPLMALSMVVTLVLLAANIIRPRMDILRKVIVVVGGLLHGLSLGQSLQDLGLPGQNEAPALIGAGIGLWAGYAVVVLGFFVALGNWVGEDRFTPRRIRLPGSLLVGAGVIALLIGRALA